LYYFTDIIMTEGNEKKIIAVMGATGNQGGAVVDALLTVPDQFAIRAITRNPESEKAKALVSRGCEVVKADADDVSSMVAALSGAYGAYLVTNFWEDMNMAHEIEQTDKLREAVIEAKIEHAVLSTLDDTRPIINASEDKDTWPVLVKELASYVPHFDGKGEAGKRFLESAAPVTLLHTCFYYDNFINFGMGPKKQAEGQPYSVCFPTGDKAFPMNSLRDIGCNVLSIFQDPSTINTCQGVCSEFNSGQDIADAFTEIIGEKVEFAGVPPSVYATFEFPGANDMANMFRYWVTFGPLYGDVADNAKRLGRKTDTMKGWIEENKAAFIPAEVAPEK